MIGAWIRLWDRREPASALALVRIFMGLVICWDLAQVVRFDLVVPLFTTFEAGGMGDVSRYSTKPELLEWVGFAIASWSLPGLAFAVYTAANLVPRALANRRWYRERFPDYPSERKALIPFLL